MRCRAGRGHRLVHDLARDSDPGGTMSTTERGTTADGRQRRGGCLRQLQRRAQQRMRQHGGGGRGCQGVGSGIADPNEESFHWVLRSCFLVDNEEYNLVELKKVEGRDKEGRGIRIPTCRCRHRHGDDLIVSASLDTDGVALTRDPTDLVGRGIFPPTMTTTTKMTTKTMTMTMTPMMIAPASVILIVLRGQEMFGKSATAKK